MFKLSRIAISSELESLFFSDQTDNFDSSVLCFIKATCYRWYTISREAAMIVKGTFDSYFSSLNFLFAPISAHACHNCNRLQKLIGLL